MSFAQGNRGDRNGNAKLADSDIDNIHDLWIWRCKRIDAIDLQIEELTKERIKIRNDLSIKQLSLKFEVCRNQMARIIKFKSRG
jgi:hypothetical protein